jgi:chromosome partitioning protein
MAKVVSLINQKGGVGKTASTNAITVCLKHRGYRALCIDFDPQGYLSFSTHADTRSHPTIYDVLKRKVRVQDAIQKTNVADVIPADALLGNVEREFTGPGAESMLRDCLKPIRDLYDYILIDSPPELGLLSANAIIASNVVLVPGLADGYSLQGFIQVHETIQRIKKAFNPGLVFGGIFLTRYYPREELSRTAQETAHMLAEHLNVPFLDTVIRHSNVISRAMTTLQVDVIDYAPRNTAVVDYQALVSELFERRFL